MVLKLYYDLMSQPSRALYILLKLCNVPFEKMAVDLRKGAHYSDEYTKVNRFQRVPVIDHDGFILTESIAIMRYFSRCNLIPDSLYPKDSVKQARVDEFLEWQHIALRVPCSMYFRVKYIDPLISGVPPSPEKVKNFMRRMEEAVDLMETHWLGRNHSYIAADNLTVADLLAACELEQPRMAGYDITKGRPNVSKWMNKVRDELSPHYEEGHIILNKVAKKFLGAREAGSKL